MVSEQQELSPLANQARDEVRSFYEANHDQLARAREKRSYYYDYLSRVLKARVAPGQRWLVSPAAAGPQTHPCP